MRPWLDWRTVRTPHYRLHFTSDLDSFALNVAQHVESIDSAITRLVGWAPPRPIQVVIDDPYSISNGYALPFIDGPVSVWWAVPPDPHADIGHYTNWGDLLATHELTHIAHLTRPSRNPAERLFWGSLPLYVGPIARRSPRWLIEGYATVIEGRVSGSGRPNNIWRPALLRQWAIEGHLPTYGQLSGCDDFNGGDFAYLGGSAFLEWLARRGGDSSLVHVWRRLTARINRTFDAAFAGVYGDAPGILYGRHVAELTRDAMGAKAELERAGLVEGELVQHLAWGTGGPALSPNSERVAITVAERDRPARVVIWSSTPDPEDTTIVRQRLEAQKRDPQDVPDRRFYPRPRRPLKMLVARNGRAFGEPRWFSDNRRVLLSRWAPRGDGTMRPDLYIWDVDAGRVTRVTRGAGLHNADPHPILNEAVATQCRAGHCDIVRVDLAHGAVRTLLEGSPTRSFFRPRFSPDGSQFSAAIAEGGRWRVVVARRDGSEMRTIGPNDGANRYDPQWASSDSLVVVSERGGIPNLELIGSTDGPARSLTRVTGAALAPEVQRKDGSIWFLSLHSRGLDVRRLVRSPTADSIVPITAERFGFAGLAHGDSIRISTNPVDPPRPYGSGPRHQRWLPGAYVSADGIGGFITIFSSDIVGRLSATATAAYGESGTPQGGALRATWRTPGIPIEAAGFFQLHEPSLAHSAVIGSDTIDATVLQATLAVGAERRGEGWYARARVGGGGGTLDPSRGPSNVRTVQFAEAALHLYQSRNASGLVERLRIHLDNGRDAASFHRVIGSLKVETTGRDAPPIEAAVTMGVMSRDSVHPFELFTVGGLRSPVSDSSLLAQRYPMPMFPTGIAMGRALLAWRVAIPGHPWTWFYEGASTAADVQSFNIWQRTVGFDSRFMLPFIPVAFAPRIEARFGAAYTLDEPYRKRVRGFLMMSYDP